MMPASPLMRELDKFLNKEVVVELRDGRRLNGLLRAIDPNTLNMVLGNVRIGRDEYSLVIIGGADVRAVFLRAVKFDLAELARRIERLFPSPGMVVYRPSERAILVMNRVRVTQEGVEGDRGVIYEKVKQVFDEYMREIREGG